MPTRAFLRRYTGYVEQFDTLIGMLTVRTSTRGVLTIGMKSVDKLDYIHFHTLINGNLLCACYSPRSPVRGASWAHGTGA